MPFAACQLLHGMCRLLHARRCNCCSLMQRVLQLGVGPHHSGLYACCTLSCSTQSAAYTAAPLGDCLQYHASKPFHPQPC